MKIASNEFASLFVGVSPLLLNMDEVTGFSISFEGVKHSLPPPKINSWNLKMVELEDDFGCIYLPHTLGPHWPVTTKRNPLETCQWHFFFEGLPPSKNIQKLEPESA